MVDKILKDKEAYDGRRILEKRGLCQIFGRYGKDRQI
jgi:hypothetical protein